MRVKASVHWACLQVVSFSLPRTRTKWILSKSCIHSPWPTSRSKSLIGVKWSFLESLLWISPLRTRGNKMTYMGFSGPIWMHLIMTNTVIFNSPNLDILAFFFVQVIVLGRMVLSTAEGLWMPTETPAENCRWIECSLRPENKVFLAKCWLYFLALA